MKNLISLCSLCLCTLFLLPIESSAQWIRQDIPSDVTMLLTVDFADQNIGAAAGWIMNTDFWGRAVYTTNGGATWLLAQIPDSSRSLVTLKFVSSDTGYIVGAYNSQQKLGYSKRKPIDSFATLLKRNVIELDHYLAGIRTDDLDNYRGLFLATTNGGQSWFTKGSLPDSIFYLIGLSFINSQIGYATANVTHFVGNACVIKTTDGGESWTKLAMPDSIMELRNISFLDSQIGIAVGCKKGQVSTEGVILRTSDGGVSWNIQKYPDVNNFTDVFFANDSLCFAVGCYQPTSTVNGAIYKSIDTGINWSPLDYEPDSVLLNGVSFIKGTGTGIVYGVKFITPLTSFISRTTDYGATWTESMIPGYSDELLVSGKLVTPSIGYTCGGELLGTATMLYTTNGGVTGVAGNDVQNALDYCLSQNYPNPFNPMTTIGFTVETYDHTSLRVYDLLGREVATLVSEKLPAGKHTRQWNATGMPSGVYFYRLQTSTFTETKKLILLR